MLYDKESSDWLICNFSYPLGLRCIHGFRASDVVHFINGKGSSRFEEHVNHDCWVCLARILLFTEIGKNLCKVLSIHINCARVQRYLKKIWRSSPSDVKVNPIWFKAKRRYIGEKTYVWLENGKIHLKIIKQSEKDLAPLIDVPSLVIYFPDPITAELLRNPLPSTL